MLIKKILKIISLYLVLSNISYSIINKIFLKYFIWFKKQRNQFIAISTHFNKNFTVRYGPFKGLKFPSFSWASYPEASIISNTLFSKLLGLYEYELFPIFDIISKKKYTEIVNIGSAEGYYSIGLGLMHKNSTIFSFDINREARKLCYNMAKFNKIHDRVMIGGLCDEEKLMSLPLTSKGLILSDCEGYEKYLFNHKTKKILNKHDLLIEIHDCIDPSISSHIKTIFSKTHNLTVIKSEDEFTKIPNLKHQELKSYSNIERQNLITENRASIMEWFFLESK